METILTSITFPLKLKKRLLEIMHEKNINLLRAEQYLLYELLEEIKK